MAFYTCPNCKYTWMDGDTTVPYCKMCKQSITESAKLKPVNEYRRVFDKEEIKKDK